MLKVKNDIRRDVTPTELPEQELFKTDVSWFHIFKELIKSGTWAKMSSNAKSLYPVIKAYINWKEGTAFPSLDTLQKFSGLARASVVKGLRELEKMELLKKTGRRGQQSTYTLMEKFQIIDIEGRPAASVTFDYLPAYIGDSLAELKNVAANLVAADGKTYQFIKIDNLTINIAGRDVNITHNPSEMPEEMMAVIYKGMEDYLAGNRDTTEAKTVVLLRQEAKKRDTPNARRVERMLWDTEQEVKRQMQKKEKFTR